MNMKSIINRLVQRSGYKIVKRVPRKSADSIDAYHAVLNTQLSYVHELRIVVVGANDGVLNDPIYRFVSTFPNRTRLVLIEPQPNLMPILRENYEFHPNCHICNCAVGDGSSMKLFRINEVCWDSLKVAYGKNWPSYRLASGVTSQSYEHVEKWLMASCKDCDPRECIGTIEVAAPKLLTILHERTLEDEIDVLQIDAEGYDDQVLYNCTIEVTKPVVIRFEWNKLTAKSLETLVTYLEDLPYQVYFDERDAFAIRRVGDRCRR